MKTLSRWMAVLLCAVTVFVAGSCADSHRYVEPKSEKQNLNLFSSTYTTGKNLQPVELHLGNDRSARVVYRYTGGSTEEEAVSAKLDDLIEELNRKIYTKETYEEGYRMFFREEGDVVSKSGTFYATMRIVDLTKVHKDNYRCESVTEFLQREGSKDMMYEFRPVDNSGEPYSIVDLPEREQKRLRVWKIRNTTDQMVIYSEGYPLYFYDAGKSTIEVTADGGFRYSQKENVYLIYQEKQPINVTVLVVGILCGVMVVGAGAVLLVTLLHRKKR